MCVGVYLAVCVCLCVSLRIVCHEEFANIEVEYYCMPGWNCSTEHVRKFSDLPANAQAFVKKIEELTGVRGKYLSSLYVCLYSRPHLCSR